MSNSIADLKYRKYKSYLKKDPSNVSYKAKLAYYAALKNKQKGGKENPSDVNINVTSGSGSGQTSELVQKIRDMISRSKQLGVNVDGADTMYGGKNKNKKSSKKKTHVKGHRNMTGGKIDFNSFLNFDETKFNDDVDSDISSISPKNHDDVVENQKRISENIIKGVQKLSTDKTDLEDEIALIRNQLAALEGEKSDLESQISANDANIADLRRQLNDLNKEKQILREAIKALEEANSEMGTKSAEAQTLLDTAEAKIDQIENNNTLLSQGIVALEKEKLETKEKINDLTEKINILESEIHKLGANVEKGVDIIQQKYTDKISNLEAIIKKYDKDMTALANQLRTLGINIQ